MKIVYWILSIAVIAGCTMPQSKNLEAEIADQPARPMHGGVAGKVLMTINRSNLPESQKTQLREVFKRMVAETFDNQEETSRVKGVLFETLTKSPYDAIKVKALKKRLVYLNDEKMYKMFWALSEVEKILDYASPDQKRDIFESILVPDVK